MVRAVVQVSPTASFELASQAERQDSLTALAGKLMGLSKSVQFGSSARDVDFDFDWRIKPTVSRTYWAAISDTSMESLKWRVRTLCESLDAIGLRSEKPEFYEESATQITRVKADMVMTVDGYWNSTLVLRRWPREVAPGWLGHALAGEIPVDCAIHVQPQNPQRIARFLNQQQNILQGEGAGHELGRGDARLVHRKLVAGTDRPVKAAIALTVRSSDVDVLRERVALLQYELALTLSNVRLAKYEQDRGRVATDPNGVCALEGAWHTLDCVSVASTWLYQPATVNHARGAPIGTSHGMLVRIDPFDESLESFGGVVLAKVGAGKSYLLKLIIKHLSGVEVLIVQQRSPNEYAHAGVQTLDLSTSPTDEERVARLRAFVTNLWEEAKRNPKPRLLILDELWSLLEHPDLASIVMEIARIGRHHYLSLWIATQQVKDLLMSKQGLSVLNNAAIKIYLKQHGPDGELLTETLRLPDEARRAIRAAARGQAVLDVSGMLIPLDIQAEPHEHVMISTDPREKYGRIGVDNLPRNAFPIDNSSTEFETDHLAATPLVGVRE